VSRVEISAVEPDDQNVLWADTSEQGDAVLPLGGGGGSVVGEGVGGRLRHDMGDLDTDDVGEGTVNLYNRVPTGGSAGEVLVKQSATDYASAWVRLYPYNTARESAVAKLQALGLTETEALALVGGTP
jgi:hypothetical protein